MRTELCECLHTRAEDACWHGCVQLQASGLSLQSLETASFLKDFHNEGLLLEKCANCMKLPRCHFSQVPNSTMTKFTYWNVAKKVCLINEIVMAVFFWLRTEK